MSEETQTREQRYVNSILSRISKDSAMAAALKRADNPATEYRSWEYLASYHVDIEKPWERIPYLTVSAAVARAKITEDGYLSLGEALARSGKDGNAGDQERARLRRLLACDSAVEVCTILRHQFSLLISRGVRLNYGKVLEDLMWFDRNPQRMKARWAQEFFRTLREEE